MKGLIAKLTIAGFAVAAFTLASPAKADAQQFAVGVEFGHPGYVAYHDGYRYDRDDYRRHEEFREREARADFLRRQEFIRHEQWERYHRSDRPYDYR
jgi:hypothetical protein